MSEFVTKPAYTPEIEAGLQRIRRRRRDYWVAFFGYLPTCTLVAIATRWFDPEGNIAGVFAVAYFATTMILAIRMQRSKCPRCEKIFAAKWYWGNPWTQSCLHCHLGMDGMPEPAAK
jgi:hypothetical protein